MARGRRGRRRISSTSSKASPSTGGKSRRGRASRSASRTRRVSVDPEVVLESVVDDIVRRLGLDLLGLNREQYKEMLRPIVTGIVEQYSSRPSREAIVSRIVNNASNVYNMAAAYVLEKGAELSSEALEFIVSNAPMVAARYVDKLYREAVRLGRSDLIPQLRAAWEMYGRPTPITCPRCGFRAVTPELVCMVCGYELSEREAKEAIDFKERLQELVEFYTPEEVREAINRGYVIVGDTVKPPTAQPEPTDVVLHLSREERKFLSELLTLRLEVRR